MKKPEEIKKGLECCNQKCVGDKFCPYDEYSNACENTLHKDALALIQQLEAQVPRWIPVDERLPESEKPVLAVVQTNSSPVFKRITVLEHINAHEVNTEDNFDWHEYEGDTEYDAENDCYWIPECWYEVNVVDDNPNWMLDDWWRVTHWMPLPEAPKEDAHAAD